YDAETVWKQGTDLRIVVSNKEIRAKVDDEVSQLEEEEQSDEVDPDAPDDESADIESAPEPVSPSEKMRIKRQYEGYAWHHIESGRLGDPVDQPPGAEYIPLRDQFDIQPDDEAWKARTAAFEIRADESGLYKVSGGK